MAWRYLPPATLLATALTAPAPASALEFTGYLRSGLALASSGGRQQCFLLPGAQSKYRLGNECEQYGEFDLRQDLQRFADGSSIRVEAMLAAYNPYGHMPDFSDNGGYSRFVQGYAKWENMSALNGGAAWAGRRYYKRNDIHINDFYYWNPSGIGFGLEDVRIGGLQYSYAFLQRDNVFQQAKVDRHDFHVAGLSANADGSLEVGLSFIPANAEAAGRQGWSVTVQHRQKQVLGGKNVLAFQYGKGPGTGLSRTGDVSLTGRDASWRLLDGLDWQLTRSFGGQVTAVYQRDSRSDGAGQQWVSLGVRPVYALTGTFKLVTEIGLDQVTRSTGKARLSKVTIAPTWSPAGPAFWARPELRLYYTYAQWNREAQASADLSANGSPLSRAGAFGSALQGSSIGVQVEYWW